MFKQQQHVGLSDLDWRSKLSPLAITLTAGWGAGIAEALACHPLDTVKVRMQLAKSQGGQRAGLISTFANIVRNEGALKLYSGISSVVTFIGPKMATRFASFEYYKNVLAGPEGQIGGRGVFTAALGAGLTEAIVVVTPMEVVKIRMQSGAVVDGQLKYRNVVTTIGQIVRESGVGGLYSGFALTALRQATNQAANLSVYTLLKDQLQKRNVSENGSKTPLPSWQTSMIGLVAGAAGPCTNAPIDTVKTRMQKSAPLPGESGLQRVQQIVREMLQKEGPSALYKGILPRVLRVGPGQAVAYAAYEKIATFLRG